MDAALLLATGMAGSGLRRLRAAAVESRPVGDRRRLRQPASPPPSRVVLGFPATDATAAARRGIVRPSSCRTCRCRMARPGHRPRDASRSPFPDAALQSFVTVAPFEVRHEVLVKAAGHSPGGSTWNRRARSRSRPRTAGQAADSRSRGVTHGGHDRWPSVPRAGRRSHRLS